ncbi:sensor histidine kinase [Amycolatopsis sp. H20-H5]|uniref:sensor histidine kinase n=1 Tax=Amycolatopsis sp. H20-H5 TaxID=3046309 RepID=UPI002DB62D54|nr:ATP-binding protein [Amycolatopsis sp. H20-H5]MEC3980565.1 ATP-binding protein [Amycolatopsis sp. H20-H5]
MTGRAGRWLRGHRWRELSLRTRLTLMAATAVAVAVIGVSITSWTLVRAKLYQQFNDQLHSYAQLAAKASSPADALTTLSGADRRNPGTEPDRSPGLVIQFVDRSGAPAGAAGGLLSIPVTPLAQQVAAGERAEDDSVVRIGPDRYRVWTVQRPDGAAQVARDSEGVENTLAELGLLHILIGLVGVAIAAVIGRLVARAALRPVDVLTAGAEQVARTQDLTAAIPAGGRGEIARLADAFNSMLGALAESKAAQRRLVEDAGHELRTPLTSLRTNVELLIHAGNQTDPVKVLPAEDRERLLHDLGVQTAELSTLIGELVELAKEDTAPEPLERLDLADVVGSAVERARPRAPHVRFKLTRADGEVLGRPVSLERAVLNLLDNAAKWSPADGVVRVVMTGGDGETGLSVADDGPGIADEDLPHVFERFYRAETARALPGSGLGLAIVHQIVTLHGGSVAARRTEAGGAEVSLTLPSAPEDS